MKRDQYTALKRLLKTKKDTVVKILGYVYPLRALCNA
jgi:hypothetical protein